MTKTCRKPILVILLALCLAALCGVMLACGNETPADTTAAYSVTVKTAEGDPAVGVDVKVKKGSASFGTKTTDADGKATFTLAKDSYTVELSKLPDGYEVEGVLSLTAEKPDLTVTLAKAFAYTVKLVQADGVTPFYAAGVKVGICLSSGLCLNPAALTESGVVSIEADKDDYRVQLIDLPAGYAYDGYAYGRTTENYYSGGVLSATVTEITVPVYPVAAADIAGTAMTAAEKEAFNAELAENAEPGEDYDSFDTSEDSVAHLFTTAALKSDDVAYYMFTPAVSGKYKLYCADKYIYNIGETFDSDLPANPMMGIIYGIDLVVQKGKTYYLAVVGASEEQAAPVKFAIVDPVSSYIEYNGINTGSQDIQVEIGKAGSNAVIAFKPTQAGAYKATAQGDTLTAVSATTLSGSVQDTYTGGEYAAGSNASVKVMSDVLSSTTVYYMIAAQAATYPVTVNVKIEQLNTLSDSNEIAAVTEALAQYAAAPAGKELTYLPMSEATVLAYNETDKSYRLGDAEGPVVLVNLTGKLPRSRFAEGGMLAYLDMNGMMGVNYIANATSDADKADLTKGNTFKDYRRFIRGFDDYEYTKTGVPQPPETLTVENCYANYVNEDGVYPLTQELKAFLELFYEANADKFEFQVWDAEIGCEWMFPLCYYGEPTEADQIVGEYATADGKTLSVAKDGSAVFGDPANDYTADASWIKNDDGTYSFVIDDWPYSVVTYDATTKTLTLFDDDTGTEYYVFTLVEE